MPFLSGPKIAAPAPPPPPPAPPSAAAPTVAAAGNAALQMMAAAAGAGSGGTVLTSGQGAASPDTRQKQLTGATVAIFSLLSGMAMLGWLAC
jgi:hypothetical protein